MRIVCDENIAITPALSALASDVVCLPGREIRNASLVDADVLLVRSVTTVDHTLLQGTPVRFVGTATAGVDHIDQSACKALDIAFAAASGSNAMAVCEWVLAALNHTHRLPAIFEGEQVGIVGLGEVGSRLATILASLGASVIGYDPYREDWPSSVGKGSLKEVTASPIVTLHAALHDQQPFPSCQLIDAGRWAGSGNGQLLLNAGRGGLAARPDLLALAQRGVTLALDTWPEEPEIDQDLLAMTALATPHIAGYSQRAKRNATDFLVNAIVRQLKLAPVTPAEVPTSLAALIKSEAVDPIAAFLDVIRQHYDIAADDHSLRASACNGRVSGADFDRLRRHYPRRPELAERVVQLTPRQLACAPWLRSLGVSVQGDTND
jgi:erythronate-4-phosphate dehydrogenase